MHKMNLSLIITVFSFWIINCTAAGDTRKEKEIIVEAIDNGITLGLVITDMDMSDKKDRKTDEGAKVLHVIEKSNAEEAGLKKDDIVVEFEGEKIKDAQELNDLVEAIEGEKTVNVLVLREGARKNIKAKISQDDDTDDGHHVKIKIIGEGDGESWSWSTSEGEDDEDALVWVNEEDGDHKVIVKELIGSPGDHNFSFGMGSGNGKGGFLGVKTDNISKQMLEYFEVGHGVLIKEIVKDSPAEKSGLKAGDVITFIEDRKISDYSDLTRTINFYNPDEEVEIDFVRKGSKKNVDVKLTKKKHTMGSIHSKGSNAYFFKDNDEDIDVRVPKMKKGMKGRSFMFNKLGSGEHKMNIFII